MGIFVLAIFWVIAIRLWILDGWRTPLAFIIIWILGFFGLPFLGLGGYFVLAFQAILAAILILVEKYKEAF